MNSRETAAVMAVVTEYTARAKILAATESDDLDAFLAEYEQAMRDAAASAKPKSWRERLWRLIWP